MKNRPLIILCLFLAGACASARLPASVETAIPVEELSGRYHFGEVYQGEKIRVEFAIRNPAPYRLSIDNVENTCGCTTTIATKSTIRPKGELSFWVILDTSRLWGPQSKSIVLDTNDPQRRRIRLTLEGIVRERLRFEPRRIQARLTTDFYETAVRVVNSSDETLEINSLTIEPSEHLSATFGDRQIPFSLAAGEAANLAFRAELTRPGAKLIGQVQLGLSGNELRMELPFYLERPEEEKTRQRPRRQP